jgi:hypothetical protein
VAVDDLSYLYKDFRAELQHEWDLIEEEVDKYLIQKQQVAFWTVPNHVTISALKQFAT